MNNAKTDLDEIDRRILASLQAHARLRNVELAEQVGLSASPCLRRVKRLEETGVIRGFATLVDPEAVGLPVSVFVQVTLERQAEASLEAFESHITEWPEVMECYLMTGDADYLLRVVVTDMRDFERIHQQHLSRLPHVQRIQSNVALRPVVHRMTPIPGATGPRRGERPTRRSPPPSALSSAGSAAA